MQNKTAQARKLRHRIRKHLPNPLANPFKGIPSSYKESLKKLNRVDKAARKEAEDLNYYLGMAKSFFRRRDYLTSASYLSQFHGKARNIHYMLNKFEGNPLERAELLKKLNPKDRNNFVSYDPRKNLEDKMFVDDGLISTAGSIKDWWKVPGRFSDLGHNLFKNKSRVMKKIEDKFSTPFLIKLKSETESMLKKTESFYRDLIETFSRMGSAWATQDVGQYLKEIAEINKSFDPYHDLFLKYDDGNLAPMRAEQKKVDEAEAKAKAEKEAAETAKKEEEARQAAEAAARAPYIVPDPFDKIPLDKGQQIAVAPEVNPPSSGVRKLAPPVLEMPERVTTNRAFPAPPANVAPESDDAPFSFNPRPGQNLEHVKPLMKYDPELQKRELEYQRKLKLDNRSHEDFLNRIEKLSNDHDIIKEILSYSEEVEKYSEEESLKLLAIAEGLIEKNAMPKKKDEAKTIKSPAPPKAKVVKIESPVKSEPYPASDPPTELIPPAPFTQRSGPGPVDAGPGTRRMPSSGLPEPIKPKVDLVSKLHQDKFLPVNHNIPFGIVKKQWGEIPFLAKKREHDIKVSPNTADLLIKTVVVALRTHHLPYAHIENFPSKFVKAIRHSITKGIIESNMQCSNNRDCQLQVFSGFYLEEIEPSLAFDGLAVSFTATLRLTDMGGDIIINKLTNVNIEDVSK